MKPIICAELIPFKQAEALKHLGFDETCFGFYNPDEDRFLHPKKENAFITGYTASYDGWKKYSHCQKYIVAPLFQQAFRWFRKEHKLTINIEKEGRVFVIRFHNENTGEIYYLTHTVPYHTHDAKEVSGFKTYEQAEIACLDELIEIVQNKQL